MKNNNNYDLSKWAAKWEGAAGGRPSSIGSNSFSKQHSLNLWDQKRLCHKGISGEEACLLKMSHWQLPTSLYLNVKIQIHIHMHLLHLWHPRLTQLQRFPMPSLCSSSFSVCHILKLIVSIDFWMSERVRVFVKGLKCESMSLMSASILSEQLRYIKSYILKCI